MKSQQLHQFVVRHTTRYWWKLWKKSTQLLNLKKKKARRSLIKVMNDNCSAKQIIFQFIHHSWCYEPHDILRPTQQWICCNVPFFSSHCHTEQFFSFPLSCHYYKWKKNWLQKITDWNYSKLIPASICHEL